MIVNKGWFVFVLSLCSLYGISQIPQQTIRGKVMDLDSKFSLPGVNVVLISDTINFIGVSTDMDGNYLLENIPVGRGKLKFSFVGYKDRVVPIVLSSGKELILNQEMEESVVQIKAVEISASKKGEVLNEMATVSARTFSVEETERYAGSRGDPARMASNFAGVQGADDSRNDIVIRGNSPLGVVYRVEGIDIPNPNHFSVSGSSGGPVSILNNKFMSGSDFFTGAFPAEYGNSVSGVFDIKLRNGNDQKYEYTGQFGFLGTEITAEGPINKSKRSSFLMGYRYSTVSLFSALGISIGTDAVPIYSDLTFKLNFPIKNGNISLFGIGGYSKIDILISEQTTPTVDLYGENDRDQYFRTAMGIGGIGFTKAINNKIYIKSTLSTSMEFQHSNHNLIERHLNQGQYVLDSIFPIMGYAFYQKKISNATALNYKFNNKMVLKVGWNVDLYGFDQSDSVYQAFSSTWVSRWDNKSSAVFAQPYLQLKYKFNDRFMVSGGIHNQWFSLNNSLSVAEPRLGMKWQIDPKSSLNAGIGLHSQMQPLYTYFYQKNDVNGNPVQHNINMGFTKSWHYVLGYDRSLCKQMRMKAETYYQSLYDVPVEEKPSAFSLVNQGSGFARFFPDTLKNTGTARNIGVELTLEKYYSNHYFFMITGSLFDSKYKGSDGIVRNTDFNGNFATNLLGGYEIPLGKTATLSLGTKLTWAGARRFGLVDTAKSNFSKEIIFQDSLYNAFQFKDYFRVDFKINYKLNLKKTTHELAIDLVNVFNVENILSITYAPVPGDDTALPYRENYQLGFLPIFYYKIDF